MRNRKANSSAKILCFILCLSFIFTVATSVAFAKVEPVKPGHYPKVPTPIVVPVKPGHNPKCPIEIPDKSASIQTLILDSMESKKNKEIANTLSGCTKENISTTAKNIANILNGSWNSKKGEASIKVILTEYLGFTTKAKLAITMIIGEGFKGVQIPAYLSAKIRTKINSDITGNQRDDRGIKFMVKALQILQRVASLNNEKFVTLTLDRGIHLKFKLNRLEEYSNITASISEVFGTLQNLPFKNKNFNSFVEYYEKYLNSCNTAEAISFLYLLRDNNIPYAIDLR